MEKDDKKEAAAKMIDTSTTDHQKEEYDDILQKLPLDSSFFYKLQIKEEPSETETESSSKKRKQVGGDVAMINSPIMPFPLDSSPSITTKKRKEVRGDVAMINPSTFPLPLDSSPNLTPKKRKEGPSQTTFSETPTKRRPGRPHGSGSASKKTKEGPSQTTSAETTSAETSTKRIPGRPHGSGSGSKKTKEGPSQTTSAETSTKRKPGRPHGTSREKFTPHTIELKAGQDVVELLFKTSQAIKGKTVIILSAFGSVSDIVNLTPAGPEHLKGEFELHSMAIKCLVDDDGHHCREKAMCTILCRDDKGKMLGKTAVNSLIVADRVKITAVIFYTEIAREIGARILDFTAADDRNEKIVPIPAVPRQTIMANLDPDREIVIKEEGSTMLVEGQTSGFLPTTPSVADADMINPTTASTSTSNDQDKKPPSEGDT